MTKDGLIGTAYDVEAHPAAEAFDPIAWFEGTGEDRGLPPEYVANYDKAVADYRAKRKKGRVQTRPR